MALRPQFSLIHSEFNDFLFAPVGEEEHGPLTVLSALTRLGVDPWREAARLSGLPRAAAAQALAATMAGLPTGDWKAADLSAIAARLVARLPECIAPAAASPQGARRRDEKAKSRVAIGLICVVVAAAAFLAMSHFRAEHPSESAPNPISSMQR
ncbi:MAG: hypothetical protein KGJ66_15635 [Alphaproteobacteria bacterium]|nr:hypothetical protein [Alphaproteobacteria bacterium]